MENRTRIRISLVNREIELEGPESFIEKYESVISEFIEKIKDSDHSGVPFGESTNGKLFQKNQDLTDSSVANPQGSSNLPSSFGEYYTRFPKSIKVTDKILLASYFAQSKSEDGMFLPKEAVDLLTEQNVQITNASVFIKSLVSSGRLFRHAGKYKVSEKGIEQILLMNNLPTT